MKFFLTLKEGKKCRFLYFFLGYRYDFSKLPKAVGYTDYFKIDKQLNTYWHHQVPLEILPGYRKCRLYLYLPIMSYLPMCVSPRQTHIRGCCYERLSHMGMGSSYTTELYV